MIIRVSLALSCLSIGVFTAHADESGNEVAKTETVLDIIPATTSVSLAIRDASELSKRGDEFIEKAKVDVPLRFTDGFRWLIDVLGIRKGLDEQGSFALMLLGKEFSLDSLVLAVPVKDFEALGKHLGIEHEHFVAGNVIDSRKYRGTDLAPYVRYFAVRGSHLLMGANVAIVKRATDGVALGTTLPKDVQRTLSKDDVLLYASGKFAFENVGRSFKSLTDWSTPNHEESKAIQQLVDAATELKFLTVGVRLDDGVGATLLMDFEGKKSQGLLTRIAGDKSKAWTTGLPRGKLLAAHASSGPTGEDAVLARAMIRLLLDNFTPQAGGFIPRAYHSIIVGLFGESWQRISGSRSALYENANPSRDGMFSLVAILETDNGEQFVSDMTGLTRFVNPSEILDDVDDAIAEDLIAKLILDLGDDRYQIRQSASVKLGLIGDPALEALDKAKQSDDAEVRYRSQTLIKEIERSLAAARADLINGDLLLRIKPRFSYFPKQESSSGRSVGFVRIRLKDDQAPLAGQLRTLFGPQWSTIRLATVDDNVIVLLGSNSSLMEQTIANVKSGRTGIDLSRRFAAFHDRVRREPTSEFHLSLSRAELQFVDRDLDKSSTTTSFGLSIAPQQVRLDLFAPFEEVRVFYERLNRQ